MVGFRLLVFLALALVAVGPWRPFSCGRDRTPLAARVGALPVSTLVIWLGWVPFWPWQGLPPPVAAPALG